MRKYCRARSTPSAALLRSRASCALPRLGTAPTATSSQTSASSSSTFGRGSELSRAPTRRPQDHPVAADQEVPYELQGTLMLSLVLRSHFEAIPFHEGRPGLTRRRLDPSSALASAASRCVSSRNCAVRSIDGKP
jgi:hypothetical protein